MFGFILKPLIRKEIKKMIEKFIIPITTFLKEIGLKSGGLVVLVGVGSIFWLEWNDKSTIIGTIVIGIITIAFSLARILVKVKNKPSKKEK